MTGKPFYFSAKFPGKLILEIKKRSGDDQKTISIPLIVNDNHIKL